MIKVVGDPFERNTLREILDSIESQSEETGRINEKDDIVMAMEAYNDFKIKFKRNIRFDPKVRIFCK